MAVGQRPDLSFINNDAEIKLDQCLVSINRESCETTAPGVFAGGELTSGPAIVAQAVAAGRKAALAIDRFLGKSVRKKKENASRDRGLLTFDSTCLKPTSPISAPVRSIQERNLHEEDCAGVSSDEIRLEANRCFNCGCVAISASDIALALIALNATIKTTQRTVAAEKFFSSNDAGPDHRAHDELLIEIVIPRLSDSSRCEFKKHRVRSSLDFPIVSLATVFTMDKDGGTFKDARIVLGAVAPWPVRVVAAEKFLKGKAPGKEVAAQAAALAVEKAVPLSGNRYKVEIVKTLIKRFVMSTAG
jgi:CO/xanthine dehydrogenase FAD-binding subunit